jgi:hypothetical protein
LYLLLPAPKPAAAGAAAGALNPKPVPEEGAAASAPKIFQDIIGDIIRCFNIF